LIDVATARANFLSRVDDYALGDSARLAPVLDEMIRWSVDNGLEHRPPTGVQTLVRYAAGGRVFWSVAPMRDEGARFTLLADLGFPESLRDEARTVLARINWGSAKKTGAESDAPALPLAKLMWEPYRRTVLDLMSRLLDGIRVTA